jgi:hypothetical protein
MIKFFRKIRQNVIREKKVSKYLIYALGEIVLVVVGILLALQINNANENRKEFKKSKDYLAEILKDIVSDTSTINKSINFTSEFIRSEEWALNKTDFIYQDADSIWMLLGGFYASLDLNDRTFQKMQNSGLSSLVGFDAIFDKITHYYTKAYNRYNQYSAWDRKVILDGQGYLQDLYDQIEISNYRTALVGRETSVRAFPLVDSSPEQIDRLIDFAKSPRGRNHVRINYVRHLRGLSVFEDTKAEAINLISEINKLLGI